MDDVIRSFSDPDETIEFGGATEQLVSIGGLTVSRTVQPAGWRWRDHFQPLVGGDRCQAHHVGMMLSGRQGIQLEDGTVVEYGPGDLYDIPPGHDGWTIGDEDCVMLEWSGMRRWVGGARPDRVLATLLFTDIVDSTVRAAELGDARWHDLLSLHYQQAADAIERYGGRRVATTGDGLLASFDAVEAGVRCAISMRELAMRQGLEIRTGIHAGEVELAGDDVRGMTVHQAARIMAAAGQGEILVSDAIAILGRPSGLVFEEAGEHELKGIPEPWRLHRVVS
jgi:class 3 adenylate cyclase